MAQVLVLGGDSYSHDDSGNEKRTVDLAKYLQQNEAPKLIVCDITWLNSLRNLTRPGQEFSGLNNVPVVMADVEDLTPKMIDDFGNGLNVVGIYPTTVMKKDVQAVGAYMGELVDTIRSWGRSVDIGTFGSALLDRSLRVQMSIEEPLTRGISTLNSLPAEVLKAG